MRPNESRQTDTNPGRGGAPPEPVEPVNRSTINPGHAARVEPFVREQLKRLSAYEVEVGSQWRAGVDPHAIYPGECFYRAALYVSEPDRVSADGLWLVHGENTTSQDRHAWVELPDGVVFDPVLQRFYSQRRYYVLTLARPWYKYTPGAARVLPLHLPKFPDGTAPYGGWHEYLGLPPWASPTNPQEIDEQRAVAALAARGHYPPSRGKPRRRKK